MISDIHNSNEETLNLAYSFREFSVRSRTVEDFTEQTKLRSSQWPEGIIGKESQIVRIQDHIQCTRSGLSDAPKHTHTHAAFYLSPWFLTQGS